MIRNWKFIKLNKELIRRKYFLKNELLQTFFKSLIRNENDLLLRRTFIMLFFILKKKKKTTISYQQNRCILTGKGKTSFRWSTMSRQSTKQLLDLGLFQNISS